ncbi:hypothetical protein LY76DRAFT_610988 [Colletotrichum caudatum]|nr:hypothetical protein LY76DRAFT_610988 [Colletotrichum caudatum]
MESRDGPSPLIAPRAILDNLRRETTNACATACTIQRRRELLPETVAGVRHAFPAEDVVEFCDAAHADLVKATRLMDDLQLANTARILEKPAWDTRRILGCCAGGPWRPCVP